MGKGSKKRPCLISREEENIRWALVYGKISFKKFEEKMKKIKENKK